MQRSFFIGIPLSARVSELLTASIKPLNAFQENFYWVPMENWHITLAFLGSLNNEELEHVTKTMNDFVTSQRYFNLYLNAAELFPAKQPKKVVISMVKNRNLLDFQFGLRAALTKAIPRLKFETFIPHISVINLKYGKLPEALEAKVHELHFKKRFEITDIALLETIVHEKPPVSYAVVSEARLVVDDKYKESDEE